MNACVSFTAPVFEAGGYRDRFRVSGRKTVPPETPEPLDHELKTNSTIYDAIKFVADKALAARRGIIGFKQIENLHSLMFNRA